MTPSNSVYFTPSLWGTLRLQLNISQDWEFRKELEGEFVGLCASLCATLNWKSTTSALCTACQWWKEGSSLAVHLQMVTGYFRNDHEIMPSRNGGMVQGWRALAAFWGHWVRFPASLWYLLIDCECPLPASTDTVHMWCTDTYSGKS